MSHAGDSPTDGWMKLCGSAGHAVSHCCSVSATERQRLPRPVRQADDRGGRAVAGEAVVVDAVAAAHHEVLDHLGTPRHADARREVAAGLEQARRARPPRWPAPTAPPTTPQGTATPAGCVRFTLPSLVHAGDHLADRRIERRAVAGPQRLFVPVLVAQAEAEREVGPHLPEVLHERAGVGRAVEAERLEREVAPGAGRQARAGSRRSRRPCTGR